MITINRITTRETGRIIYEIMGLSTDDKPVEINGGLVGNGSSYYQMDTQSVFLFDEENKKWIEQ